MDSSPFMSHFLTNKARNYTERSEVSLLQELASSRRKKASMSIIKATVKCQNGPARYLTDIIYLQIFGNTYNVILSPEYCLTYL